MLKRHLGDLPQAASACLNRDLDLADFSAFFRLNFRRLDIPE
jgi:hypothetical protein